MVALIVGGIIIYHHSQQQDFDMTPRDKAGDSLGNSEEDVENNPAESPVYEEEITYDDWVNWENLLQEAGIIDIRDGMIEYETGDNSRMFIALAEMQQSNPYLKTPEELLQQNAIQEVFFNSIREPLKITSQSQRVEMTNFLNQLKENSQKIIGSNTQMKDYATEVIEDTLNYQQQAERFENKAYLQFMAVIKPEEVYGDSVETLEEQIHEKAFEKLSRQIERANGLLRRADHALAPLASFGLIEVLYKTFNRKSSVKIRLENIIKQQKYQIFTSAKQPDKFYKEVQQRIHIEEKAINHAREILLKEQKEKNDELLAKGKDYYSEENNENSTNKDNVLENFDFKDLN